MNDSFSAPRRVFLFDLDGVLVEPRGYRAAIHATLEHFTRRMGLGDCYPGEEAIARFESISMTSEWDIVPTCLAAILDALLAEHPSLKLPDNLEDACAYLCQQNLPAPQVDLTSLTQRLGDAYYGGTYADLELVLSGHSTYRSEPPAIAESCKESPLFAHLSGHPLLNDLLARTRQVTLSPTTRLFQTFALGSAAFTQVYGVPAEIDTPSFLKEYDQPLILPQTRASLLHTWQAGALDLAVYTARPSLPGENDSQQRNSYSPEAELALEVVGMTGVPLVGYGQICHLAELCGRSPDEMVKPSPVQALAAIGTAVRRQALPALLAAESLVFGDRNDRNADGSAYFRSLPALEIHVFEDAAGGVRAVCQAADLLIACGCPVTVHAWGITTNPTKSATLRQAGAEVFPDINTTLREIGM